MLGKQHRRQGWAGSSNSNVDMGISFFMVSVAERWDQTYARRMFYRPLFINFDLMIIYSSAAPKSIADDLRALALLTRSRNLPSLKATRHFIAQIEARGFTFELCTEYPRFHISHSSHSDVMIGFVDIALLCPSGSNDRDISLMDF